MHLPCSHGKVILTFTISTQMVKPLPSSTSLWALGFVSTSGRGLQALLLHVAV